MPQYHYVMDRYFSCAIQPDGFRRESAQIKAMGDDQAISEAKMFGPLKDQIWFEVRKVEKKGSQVIYSSKNA
jgi:hypothetical protein